METLEIAERTRRDEYVHAGRDTLGGRYLRQFWHPVCESARLNAGQALPIHIMGEGFALYRGESGTAYVMDLRCPHRGTQLSTGRIEGEDLRCYFHGWKFNPAGRCIEQPAEPAPFCSKVQIGSYPTQEYLGLVFAYFGDGPAPPLPRWPEFEACESVSSMAVIPCNYFQSAENIVDDVHVGYAHATVPEIGRSPRGAAPPHVSALETPYGLSIAFENHCGVACNHFVMPNCCYLSYPLQFQLSASTRVAQMRTVFWYVPIDDTSHYHTMITAGNSLVLERMRQEKATQEDIAPSIAAVLRGTSRMHIDQSCQRTPNLIRIQDGVTIAGQGPIADRSRERLGASDAGVIMLRRIWSRELRYLAEGRAATPFSRPENFSDAGPQRPLE